MNLAAIRYRNALVQDGGPLSALETGRFDLNGQSVFQANATLSAEFAPRRSAHLFSPVDGSGTHRLAAVARHIAISEALERWALLAQLSETRPDRFGFGEDPTSNGMAAYPGLVAIQARRFAWFEAVERYALFGWWESRLQARFFNTNWTGVSGIEIISPFREQGAKVVVLFTRSDGGRYAYGHAASGSLAKACEKALVEMCRHQLAVEMWDRQSSSAPKAERVPAAELGLFERRALFFASADGFAEFWERVEASNHPISISAPVSVFDGEIPGPWSRYAPVWRVVFRPATRRYLEDGKNYFFW